MKVPLRPTPSLHGSGRRYVYHKIVQWYIHMSAIDKLHEMQGGNGDNTTMCMHTQDDSVRFPNDRETDTCIRIHNLNVLELHATTWLIKYRPYIDSECELLAKQPYKCHD